MSDWMKHIFCVPYFRLPNPASRPPKNYSVLMNAAGKVQLILSFKNTPTEPSNFAAYSGAYEPYYDMRISSLD